MVEDVLKEIRTAVTTFLPAAFNVEDAAYAAADVAEFGAAIVLRDVVAVRFEALDAEMVQTLPALFLLPKGTEEEPWMHDRVHEIHTIEATLVEAETDPERLARRLFRMTEALRRVLTQRVEGTGTAEDPTFQVDISDRRYSALFELEPGGLAKAATLTMRASEVEERP